MYVCLIFECLIFEKRHKHFVRENVVDLIQMKITYQKNMKKKIY